MVLCQAGYLVLNQTYNKYLPGSEFGKLIKSCFKAPKGWLFTGADFASLGG